jgi:ABC-type lipoprotein export system ATPase subunit
MPARAPGRGDAPAAEAYEASQRLTGEGFAPEARLPSLSGGQSRALMIADVAVLGEAPVVLVDEIENAGVDRLAALELLSGKGRIVLLATHDPGLALTGERRAVLGNGAVRTVRVRTPQEAAVLEELLAIERRVDGLRRAMRAGDPLS